MKRCLILAGADIGACSQIRALLRDDDFVICCDSGLKHCGPLGLKPDLIVGDFDSHEKPDSDAETIVLPREKDDTDSVYAVKEALKRGFEDFLILGAVGNRLDHSLCNVSLLLMLRSLGKSAVIADDYSEMEIVSREPVSIPPSYPYFSLLNISGTAREINVTNAKYPLENAEISCTYQYGVSNEPLPGKTATVSVGEGELLLIKVRGDRPAAIPPR